MNRISAIDLLGKSALVNLGKPGGNARKLALIQFLREGLLSRAIELLGFAPGGRGLDVGCGIGLPALMLARAMGHKGEVVGLDRSEKLLAHARDLAGKAGPAPRLRFLPGDMNRLPFPDNHFDWLISIDCAGYAPTPDPVKLLRGLGRVVKPGGPVVIMAWSGQQLLPGHPRLEARLGATPAGLAPYQEGAPPEHHFSRALGWFQAAGYQGPTAHTLAQDLQAPLSPEQRLALASLLDMRWPGAAGHLSNSDQADFLALISPDSPGCLLDRPDYHAWFTYTLFKGLKP